MDSKRLPAFIRHYAPRVLIPVLALLAFYLAFRAGSMLKDERYLASVGVTFGAAVVWQMALFFLQKVTGKRVSLFL